MLFQKIKPVISSCFLYIKKKIIKKILKINITKLFIKIVCFFNRNTPT